VTKIGQIIPNAYEISRYITSLAAREDVHNIIEIGTWNGMGSTRCVLDGIRNKNSYVFVSYECFDEMYNEAIYNNKDYLSNNFRIIRGKIVNESDIYDWFDINSLNGDQQQWLKQDMERMARVPNVFNTIPDIIDLLILDGGEFSTYKEWLLLKDRTKYIVMDDTTCLKSKKIREEIMGNPRYKIIADCLTERNGYLVGKLRE
jgi:hypothetical protein